MKEKLIKSFDFVKEFIKSNKALTMKIIAVMIVIIAIVVIASCFGGDKFGNSIGNSSNLGLVAQEGSWIYYIQMDDDEPIGIYKVKNNGKNMKKVADGQYCGLNIIGNYIYCIEYDEDKDKNNLIRMKTNGKNKETLATNIDIEQTIAVGKWVYYIKNDCLYRIKLDGTDREEISDKNIKYYHIDGNTIYYIYENDSAIYVAKMKLNGEDSQRLLKAEDDENYNALYVKGSKIYYIISKFDDNYDYQYYLCSVNKKGLNQKNICKLDENIDYINMQEDAIYYTITEDYDSYLIKTIKYNGTDKEVIKKVSDLSNINITKDWVVFLGENDEYDTIMKMIELDGNEEKEL